VAQQLRRPRKTYDYEEGDPASVLRRATCGPTPRPPAYRFATTATCGNKAKAAPGQEQVASVRDPVLAQVTNRMYRGFDLAYPGRGGAKVFLSDLAGFEKSGEMPSLTVMRLGNDHTYGTEAGQTRRSPARRITITRWAS